MISNDIILAHIKVLSGNNFEDFTNKLLTLIYEDFQPVKAAGSNGDFGNDGYCYKIKYYFASYAPEKYEKTKTINKIESDFNRAKENWDITKWIFITKENLNADIHKYLETLRLKNNKILIENWGSNKIIELIQKQTPENISKLLNFPYDSQIQMNDKLSEILSLSKKYSQNKLEFSTLNEIIRNIEYLESEEFIDDKKLIEIDTKIEKNKLSNEFKEIMYEEMQKVNQIDKFLKSEIISQKRIKNFVKVLKFKYKKLKDVNYNSNMIFNSMVEELSNNKDENYMAGVISIICYFFSMCVIFEK